MFTALMSRFAVDDGTITKTNGATSYVPPARQPSTGTSGQLPAEKDSLAKGTPGTAAKALGHLAAAALTAPSTRAVAATRPSRPADLDALGALLAQRARVQALVDALPQSPASPTEAAADEAGVPTKDVPAQDAQHLCEVAKEVVDLAQKTTELLGGLAWRDRETEAQQRWRVRFSAYGQNDHEEITPAGWEPIDATYKTLTLRKRAR